MLGKIILEIARNAPDAMLEESMAGLSELDWQQLIEVSRSLKITPEAANRLIPVAPPAMSNALKTAVASNSLRMREHLTALKRISTCAEAEGLRFVVVRGLSHAAICRGNLLSRQTGDIDLLVDTADIARCDHVLREAGFRQPANPSKAIAQNYASSQAEQYLAGPQRPYPTRPKVHSDQLHPYYANDMLVKVEIHDGLHYIPQDMIRHLLWTTQMTKMGPMQIRVLQEPAMLLVLMANTFQNSENIHAKFDGEANLRDYIDLRCFFERFHNQATYQRAAELIIQSKLVDESRQVLSNYCELFPAYQTPLDELLPSSRKVTQERPFLERLFNKPSVYSDAIAEAKSVILPMNSKADDLGSCVIAGKWTILENDFSLPVEYMVSVSGCSVSLSWRLPSNLDSDLSFLAFQFGLIPKVRTRSFETLIAFSFDESGLHCTWQASNRPRQKLVTYSEERDLKCTKTNDSSSMIFSTEIDMATIGLDRQKSGEGLGIIPMAFQKDTASEYRALNLGEECYLTPLSLIIS